MSYDGIRHKVFGFLVSVLSNGCLAVSKSCMSCEERHEVLNAGKSVKSHGTSKKFHKRLMLF